MKNLYTILVTSLIIACNTNLVKTEKGIAMISGKISNPTDSMANILDEYGKSLIMGKLDSSGSFNINVDLEGPSNLYFEYGDKFAEIYLEPGMDLNISMSTKYFYESIKFKGNGSAYNNYLMNKTLLVEKIEDNGGVSSMNELKKIKTYYIN